MRIVEDTRGNELIYLKDMCDILRNIREDMGGIGEMSPKQFVRTVASLMFWDDVHDAKTEEDRELARWLPGDFIVVKPGKEGKRRKIEAAFVEFENNEPVFGNCDNAMVFKYEEMANEVAQKLGKEWRVVCIGFEDHQITQRLLKAIMGEEEE